MKAVEKTPLGTPLSFVIAATASIVGLALLTRLYKPNAEKSILY